MKRSVVANYTTDELQEALRPIASLISKSEKAQQKLTPGTWQYTMLRDNLNALRIAAALLKRETDDAGSFPRNDLQQALRALASMISRAEQAQAKFSPGTSQHTLQRNRLQALRTGEALLKVELAAKADGAGRDPTGGTMRPTHQIFALKFAEVYPLYLQKAERKNRTKKEVDQIIRWLTGYTQVGLQRQLKQGNDFETFFAQAPALNPNRALITGVVCGVRVEDIEDPLLQNIRYLDKLIDELAKGKALEKILRQSVV